MLGRALTRHRQELTPESYLVRHRLRSFDSAFVSSFRRWEETKQKTERICEQKVYKMMEEVSLLVQRKRRQYKRRVWTRQQHIIRERYRQHLKPRGGGEEGEEITRQHRADITCCFLHDNQWQQHTILESVRTTRREQKTSRNKHKHARGNADEDFITTTALRQQ